ncbi:MAG: flotillin family protein [Anaerolineae bacterium]|nr:flotillin family protein [Anaerolineae bacterium]NUQ04174.1 flotillin family protein [Anaerolineae bacterium]
MIDSFLPLIIIVVVIVAMAVVLPGVLLGLVVINERQVGVVIRRFSFSGKSLPKGRLIALEGEPGYQADTLAPGWHLGYFSWMYSIIKVPVTVVPQGEIALVVAADGAPVPPDRILGKVVDSDNYQDARKFLTNGGEKGRQLKIITGGTYRINTALFNVITRASANQNGMDSDDLSVYSVEPDMVGIVTTLDGKSIPEGEIAALFLPGHENFQNAQAFIDAGGQRGLQEQVLLSGSWNLNPWFVRVEQVPMTEIPIGYVGVVISFIGKAHEDISGTEFKHGDLVNVGHKGVWAAPLYPGKHPINTRVMRTELVPTTNIVLNWADRTEMHGYDSRLNSITVRSQDGFAFNLEIAQVIHIGALEASRVISRVGSMQNLVDHVLEPIVANYFRNAAQRYTVLDFLSARSDRQSEAAQHVRTALRAYDVEAIDTLLGAIDPPPALMATLTDRKIAEEQKKTYEVQEIAQVQRQQLVRQTEMANIQQQVVQSEQGVNIAELQAQAAIKQASGDAESIRLRASGEADAIRGRGEAQASAHQLGAAAMGMQGYTALQLMQQVGENSIRIIPDVLVSGGGAGGGSMVEALLGVILSNQLAPNAIKSSGDSQSSQEDPA